MDMSDQEKQRSIMLAKRRYHAEYRRKNKARIREAHDKYWLSRALEYRAMNMLGDHTNDTGELDEA